MSYTATEINGNGGFGTARNVTGLPANNRIQMSGTFPSGGVATQDIVAITGSTNNDGQYHVIAVNTGSDFVVQETSLVTSPVDGQVKRYARSAQKQAATAVTTAFIANGALVCSGATFITNKVVLNDRVTVIGSTSNDGHYHVTAVVSETELRVNATFAAEAAAGNVTVFGGAYNVEILDETTPTWTTIGTALGTRFVRRNPGGAAATNIVDVYGINTISIKHSGATLSTWHSLDEEVTSYHTTRTNVQADGGNSLRSILNLGQAGSDSLSSTKGSVWCNFVITGTGPDTFRPNMYGSTLFGGFGAGSGSDLIASIITHGNASVPGLFGGGTIDSVVFARAIGEAAWFAVGVPTSMANVLLSEQKQSGVIGFVTAETNGLLLAADVTKPALALLSATHNAVNNREDYAPATIWLDFGGSTGNVIYTWTPTFVERDIVASAGSPVAGLTVAVYRVNEDTKAETEHELSPFVADANGQINGGVGVRILRASITGTTTTYYSTRIVIEGGNYRAQDVIRQFRSKTDDDWPVDFQQTDYEGEFSR